MPRPSFPKALWEFQSQFATEQTCASVFSRVQMAGRFCTPTLREPAGATNYARYGRGSIPVAGRRLHKFRRAMVNASREPLRDEVEIDDTWIGGTQAALRGSQDGSRDELQVRLDEFVFRHNRHKQPMAAFQTLLGPGTAHQPTEYKQIRGAAEIAGKTRPGAAPQPIEPS